MKWLWVLAAAAAEICGVVGLKQFSTTRHLRHLGPFIGGFGLSFLALYTSFKYLPISSAYAVWIGLGTAGAVVVNMIFFHEKRNPGRVMGMVLIVIGAMGVKWLS